MTKNIIFSGFGGQGILFAGKALAKSAMYSGYNVSWLPSYGPEMRGGAANCTVVISDEKVGSPIITNPDILIAMNLPSFNKFEPTIVSNGIIISDSSLVNVSSKRKDINSFCIPATNLATANKLTGGANVIMLGFLLKITSMFPLDEFQEYVIKDIPDSKSNLKENNKKALSIGYNYKI